MNLNKRLSELEMKINPVDGAWLAFIDDDGSVSLSHHKHGKVNLTSREALQCFISENGLDSDDTIRIIIVDSAECKGTAPKEL